MTPRTRPVWVTMSCGPSTRMPAAICGSARPAAVSHAGSATRNVSFVWPVTRAIGECAVQPERADRCTSVRTESVWIGTRDAGLNRLEPTSGEVTVYRHDPLDPGEPGRRSRVRDPDRPRRPDLWVGTDAGLSGFDAATGRFRSPARSDRVRPDESQPTAGCARSSRTGRARCGSAPTAAV